MHQLAAAASVEGGGFDVADAGLAQRSGQPEVLTKDATGLADQAGGGAVDAKEDHAEKLKVGVVLHADRAEAGCHDLQAGAAGGVALKDLFKMSSARLLRSLAGPAEAVVGDRGTRARRALGADRSTAPPAEAAPPPLSGSPADR